MTPNSPIAKDQRLRFKCYDCRERGDYSFFIGKNRHPDKEEIAKASKKIRDSRAGTLLQTYVPDIRNFTPTDIPSTMPEYMAMEHLHATYDLTAVAQKKGPLFSAIHSFFNTNKTNANIQLEFGDLTSCQLVHLAILLV